MVKLVSPYKKLLVAQNRGFVLQSLCLKKVQYNAYVIEKQVQYNWLVRLAILTRKFSNEGIVPRQDEVQWFDGRIREQ